MRISAIERALAGRKPFYPRGVANLQPADWNEWVHRAEVNNRPGAVVGRIILAVVAFAVLATGIQVALKLAHIV
jgi:hypothetical protein